MTCGSCRWFRPHKETMPRFMVGLWMGDGECQHQPLAPERLPQGKITVIGDACDYGEAVGP